jgi:hypothetical protein
VIAVTNLNASNITTGTLSASTISGGTLNANLMTVSNLSASSITTGTLTADRISGGTLSGITLNITGAATFQNKVTGTTSPAVVTIGSGTQGDVAAANDGTLHLGATSAATAGASGTFTSRLQLENGFANFRDSIVEAKRFDVYQANADVNSGTRRGTIRGSDTVAGRVVVERTAGSGDVTLYVDGNIETVNGGDLTVAGTLSAGTFSPASISTGAITATTIDATGIIEFTSGDALALRVTNGITVGATDGVYWGTASTAPNLYYSTGWKFSDTTAAASTVDAVFNGSSSTAGLQTLVRVSSSEKYKQNISYLDFPIDEIVKLQPSEYEYRVEYRGTDENDNPYPARKQVGIIAESAVSNSVWSKLVVNDEDGQPDSWRYSLMGPVLLSAIRQLHAKNIELEARVAELEA